MTSQGNTTMLRKVYRALPRAIGDPGRAIEMFRRRYLPFGLVPKDKEAYRLASWSYGDIPRVGFDEMFDAPSLDSLSVHFPHDRSLDLSLDLLELNYLISIVRLKGARKVLEIGTWDGNTALNLVANMGEGGRVVTIDLPPASDGKMDLEISPMNNNVTNRELTGIRFIESPFADRVEQVFGDSASVAWDTLGGPFDLVFVDGCHDYAYVESDTRNALRVIANGGVIVWHDYGMLKDVSAYLDRIAGALGIRVISGTRMAVALVDDATAAANAVSGLS